MLTSVNLLKVNIRIKYDYLYLEWGRIISGARKAGVPLHRSKYSLPLMMTLLQPKSLKVTLPRALIKTFSGFRSP